MNTALRLMPILFAAVGCTPPKPNPAPIPPVPTNMPDAAPPPTPAPTPTTCDAYEASIGAQLICVAFENGQTPGALLVKVDAECTASDVAAAQAMLAALDTNHKCIAAGAKSK